MNENEYLDAAKKATDVTSDYALSQKLGISKAVISQYRSGKRRFDNYTAAKIAESIGINVLEIIANAELGREKDEKKREYWKSIIKKAALAALLSLDPEGSKVKTVSHGIHYAKYALIPVSVARPSNFRSACLPHRNAP